MRGEVRQFGVRAKVRLGSRRWKEEERATLEDVGSG
jgi:hypothetical protein